MPTYTCDRDLYLWMLAMGQTFDLRGRTRTSDGRGGKELTDKPDLYSAVPGLAVPMTTTQVAELGYPVGTILYTLSLPVAIDGTRIDMTAENDILWVTPAAFAGKVLRVLGPSRPEVPRTDTTAEGQFLELLVEERQ